MSSICTLSITTGPLTDLRMAANTSAFSKARFWMASAASNWPNTVLSCS